MRVPGPHRELCDRPTSIVTVRLHRREPSREGRRARVCHGSPAPYLTVIGMVRSARTDPVHTPVQAAFDPPC